MKKKTYILVAFVMAMSSMQTVFAGEGVTYSELEKNNTVEVTLSTQEKEKILGNKPNTEDSKIFLVKDVQLVKKTII